jgi:hypothetical protein
MEYMHRTSNFQSDIVTMVKEKQGQCTVGFRSEGDVKRVTFEMLHICDLRIDREDKQSDCPCYKRSGENKQISCIIYSKQPIPVAPMAH